MYFSKYKKTGPEILKNSEKRMEDGVAANAKIRKVENVDRVLVVTSCIATVFIMEIITAV